MKKFFIAVFIIIPVVISGIILIKPDKDISENENRSLKTLKTISADSFRDDIEAYFCDQFVFRDAIVSLKSNILYMTGKRDINGCYICTDRLIQKITDNDIDEKSCRRYAEKINELAKGTETFVIPIPSAGISLKDKLPKNAPMYDYDRMYASLSEIYSAATVIDVRDCLTSSESYYLTDHHWTAEGAYAVYQKWCHVTGTDAKIFKFETVTEKFRGSLYSKAPVRSYMYDKISAPVTDDNIKVIADSKQIGLYDKSALDTKNMYDFFEGGNHGIMTIENDSVKNGKVLLILKDSFANSFVPYLIGDYSKIIMLDERYTFVLPSEIIEAESIDRILVLKEMGS